jgi:hypothetical protein
LSAGYLCQKIYLICCCCLPSTFQLVQFNTVYYWFITNIYLSSGISVFLQVLYTCWLKVVATYTYCTRDSDFFIKSQYITSPDSSLVQSSIFLYIIYYIQYPYSVYSLKQKRLLLLYSAKVTVRYFLLFYLGPDNSNTSKVPTVLYTVSGFLYSKYSII